MLPAMLPEGIPIAILPIATSPALNGHNIWAMKSIKLLAPICPPPASVPNDRQFDPWPDHARSSRIYYPISSFYVLAFDRSIFAWAWPF